MRRNIIGEPIQTSQTYKRYAVTLRIQSSKQHQYTTTHLGNTTVMAVSIGAQFGSPHWTSWTVTITPSRMVGGMSMSDHSSTRAIPALRSATACGSSAGCPGINMAYCVAGCYQGVRDSSVGLVLCGEGPGWSSFGDRIVRGGPGPKYVATVEGQTSRQAKNLVGATGAWRATRKTMPFMPYQP